MSSSSLVLGSYKLLNSCTNNNGFVELFLGVKLAELKIGFVKAGISIFSSYL